MEWLSALNIELAVDREKGHLNLEKAKESRDFGVDLVASQSIASPKMDFC